MRSQFGLFLILPTLFISYAATCFAIGLNQKELSSYLPGGWCEKIFNNGEYTFRLYYDDAPAGTGALIIMKNEKRVFVL